MLDGNFAAASAFLAMNTGAEGLLSSPHPTSQERTCEGCLQRLGHAAHGCGRHHRRGLARVALLNCPAASQVRLLWAPRAARSSTFCPGVFQNSRLCQLPWEAQQQLPLRREFSRGCHTLALHRPLRGPPGLSDGPYPFHLLPPRAAQRWLSFGGSGLPKSTLAPGRPSSGFSP